MKISSPVGRRRCRIEIIPLIDIMFFLLASFMMVSLQLEQAHNIKVNLPSAARASADFKPGLINIAVDTNGQVWLEKKPITLPELRLVLSNRFRLDTNLPVYLSGDGEVRQGAVSDLLLAIRNVGVQKVAFMVRENAGGPGSP
ncbi:MAG: biopolymer transporter ExbD [Verrucomicrobiota bacterium]